MPADNLETKPTKLKVNGDIPNTPLAASFISFLLGCGFVFGQVTFWGGKLGIGFPWWAVPLGYFLSAWCLFHWLEFAVTAGWNRDKCSVDSFLLNNGKSYHIAHTVAILEYLLTSYFIPGWKRYQYVSEIGIVLTVVGQALRSMAMIHAASNFSHPVAFVKDPGHVLVTDGIYRYLRHPSYTGFFYWALGTQLVLQNLFSFWVYAVILWRFFYYRTRGEERALERFFGEQYVAYRKRVGTYIPFVP